MDKGKDYDDTSSESTIIATVPITREAFHPLCFFTTTAEKPSRRVRTTEISLGNPFAIAAEVNLISKRLAEALKLDATPYQPVRLHLYMLDKHVDTIFARVVYELPVQLALVDATDLAYRLPPSPPSPPPTAADEEDVPSTSNGFEIIEALVYPVDMPRNAITVHLHVSADLVDTFLAETKGQESAIFPLHDARHAIISRALVDSFPGRIAHKLPVARQHELLDFIVADYSIDLTIECFEMAFTVDGSIVKGFPKELGLGTEGPREPWLVVLEF